MTLTDIVGADGTAAITNNGAIRFHAVGDTGNVTNSEKQQEVADDMALDYHPDSPGNDPAFFLHLGDVIYGHDKEHLYRDEFYRPYMHYPGKIIAIPGNHDGEVFAGSDPEPVQAYRDNFCMPEAGVPPTAAQVGIVRQMVPQPGVYWWLDCPFVDVIGLYSNVLEGPGSLVGEGGDRSQLEWLDRTLATIAERRRGKDPAKALIIATHHPAFSSSGHSGSPAMVSDLDAALNQAGITYDLALAGHAHNYQRYTRRIRFGDASRAVPHIVAGAGGHGVQKVKEAYGQPEGDHTYDAGLGDFSYVLVTVSASQLKVEAWQVGDAAGNQPFDTVNIDLQTHELRT
jgi:predicted phosphodiesterase